MCSLTHKYNVPGPRYTSYPTVPYWDSDSFSPRAWKESTKISFDESFNDGISIYIHLPFCESMCTFCGCHKRITKKHEVEDPYIKAVIKEWGLYRNLLGRRPVIKELHLGGGTPTFFSPENLTKLIEGIFKSADKAPNAELSFEGHPNNTTKAHLQALYNLGFRRVCFGVQDYNETVQMAINRIQPFEKVKEVTETARSVGYTSVGHDIIYGLPFQSIAHVENTINKTNELRPDRIAFYSYAHVPWKRGTAQRGFSNDNLPTASEKKQQYQLGKKLLTEIGNKDIGMDHFALETDTLYKAVENGTLHRNFMGYTPNRTQLMIGLGASSISDSWYAFAQNIKSVVEYQNMVNDNIIPVFRGHILNEEDQLVRKHILNLMCHFETSWQVDEMDQLDFQHILDNLEELESDGLVTISPNNIAVTEKGRPFIRNISMAFDVKLQRNKPETRLFSMTV